MTKKKFWKIVKEFAVRHKAAIRSVVMSKDNKYIVSCSADTEVKLWNLKGDVLATIDTKQMKNNRAIISGDSRFLAVGAFTADVKIWEILGDKKSGSFSGLSKTPVMNLRGHKGGVPALDFSLDSKKVATASNDGFWRLFDIDKQYKKK